MGLSHDVIQEFVKITNDKTEKKDITSLTGVISVDSNGNKLVRLGGENADAIVLTPVDTVSSVEDGDFVKVDIKDHTAVVIGNISSPSGSAKSIQENATKIENFDNIIAYNLSASEVSAATATINELKALLAKIDTLHAADADIANLIAKLGSIKELTSEQINSAFISVDNLRAILATFESITADDLKVANAYIDSLEGLMIDFKFASITNLEAEKARINSLEVNKLDASFANIDSANINTANIEAAAIKKLIADGGIINEVTSETGTFTKYLVGVTIKGDLIEGGTVKADKLILKGENGLYYKMNIEGGSTVTEELTKEDLQNGLDGTLIIANTITADKISVSDLVAFGATIGGINISDGAIYSGAKSSINKANAGFYLDKDGQFLLGDGYNYIKYYLDINKNRKLTIYADSISIKSGDTYKNIENAITNAETAIEQNAEAIALRATKTEVAEEIDNIQIGGRNLLRNSDSLSYVDYYFEYDASPKIGYGVIGVMRLGGINGSMIIDQVYYANKVDDQLILE